MPVALLHHYVADHHRPSQLGRLGKWPGGTKALTMYHEGGGGGGGRIEKKRKMHLGRRLLLSFLVVLCDACGGFERKKKGRRGCESAATVDFYGFGGLNSFRRCLMVFLPSIPQRQSHTDLLSGADADAFFLSRKVLLLV